VGIELKHQLRAIAEALAGGHPGLARAYIDALIAPPLSLESKAASRMISRRGCVVTHKCLASRVWLIPQTR
jgi:hypothetical protein